MSTMNLKLELERAKEEDFIPLEAVYRIINAKNLEDYFRDNGSEMDPEDWHEILLKAPRLFAILVLLDRGWDVQKYLLKGCGDKDLPFLQESDIPEIGSLQDRKSLYYRQWEVPATLVPAEHRTFPVEFIPPLKYEAHRPKGNGAFGHVFEVRMADGHLPGYSSRQLLALKTIRVEPAYKRETVMREVQTLQARKHDHIVPLIASWTAPVPESESEATYLNLLFPNARMNLKQWLYSPRTPEDWRDQNQGQLKEYIHHSILSISRAVVFVHREIEGFISSHHDIKPSNILLFGQIWKLADFGRTHLLRSAQVSDTEGTLGTYTYQPPEYRDDLGQKAEKRHGRAFDVWSLGCITIELLTIAVYGWKHQQLSRFREQRIKNHHHPKSTPGGQGHDDSFFNNMKVVQDWTCQLLRDDGSSNLTSMLTIVEAMMIEEASHRYLSWEVYLDLYGLLHPNSTIEEVETETRAIVQQPSHHHGKREHNPLRRAYERGNKPRVKCLLRTGWDGHPLDLPEVDLKDPSEIVMWIRTAKAMRGLKWRRLVRKTIHSSPSLAANARARGLSQGSQPPDLGSSKKIWSAVEALESSRSSPALRKGSVDEDEHGMTKIHHECQKSHFWKVLQYWHKTSPKDWDSIMTHEDSMGWLPLHYAANNGSSKIIEYLLETFSLKPAVLVAWQDKEGRTPLHLASQQGDLAAIKSLLHGHMDPVAYSKMKDNRKMTARDVAHAHDHQEAYELLDETGNPEKTLKQRATGLI